MKEEFSPLFLSNMSFKFCGKINILDEMSPSNLHGVHVLMPTSDPVLGSSPICFLSPSAVILILCGAML